jgi:hypothetical protein
MTEAYELDYGAFMCKTKYSVMNYSYGIEHLWFYS